MEKVSMANLKVIEALDEAYDMIDEMVKVGDAATPTDIATLVITDGVAKVIFPDQSSHKIEYSNVSDLIAKVRSLGYEIVNDPRNPIEQAVATRRTAVAPMVRRLPASPTPAITPGPVPIPRPAPDLPEPARTYNEVEILRRLVERRLRDSLKNFNIKVLYHTKPLKSLSGMRATFFTEPATDDRYDFNVSLNAVWLTKLTQVVIATNTDYATKIYTVNESTDAITAVSRKLSEYGDGSVSLDNAVERLMGAIRSGTFEVITTLGMPLVTIPALGLRHNFSQINVETVFTNTSYDAGTSTYKNWHVQAIYYDISPAYISFDLYRYAKMTNLDRMSVITTPGNPHQIRFTGRFPNAGDEAIIDKYFISGDKTVPGYMEVSIIAIVFAAV